MGNWTALAVWNVSPAWLFPVAAVSFLFFTLYEFGYFWRAGVYGADIAVGKGIDYARSLKLATNAFEFLGTGANKLTRLDEFEPAMQRCHREDRAIRFLLLDPRDHVALSDAARRAGHEGDEYQRRVKESLRRIANLLERRRLNIEVRFYRDSQPFRLVFIDGVLCLFGYNVYGEREDFQHPQLHIVSHRSRRDVGSFYYPLRAHFEDLWKRAVNWNPEEWS